MKDIKERKAVWLETEGCLTELQRLAVVRRIWKLHLFYKLQSEPSAFGNLVLDFRI